MRTFYKHPSRISHPSQVKPCTKDPARRMNPRPQTSRQMFSALVAYPQGVPGKAVGSALAEIGLSGPNPVLILAGGATSLDTGVAARLLPLFWGLVPLLDRQGAAVIDGGTPFGVMALMGAARQVAAGNFPLIGIAPRGCVMAPAEAQVSGPGSPIKGYAPRLDRDEFGPRVLLDPNHSHFLLVPGDRWGDESPWLTAVAERLAGGRGTLMLVAGGGEVTQWDVLHRLRQRGRVLTLAGSGGTADALVAWHRGEQPPPVAELIGVDQSRLEVLDLKGAGDQLPGLLAQAFAI